MKFAASAPKMLEWLGKLFAISYFQFKTLSIFNGILAPQLLSSSDIFFVF